MNALFRVQGSTFKVQRSTFNVQGPVCESQIVPVALNVELRTRSTERAALGVLLAAAMLLVPMAALSQELADPTQPPAGLAVQGPAGAPVSAGAPNQLQSVIISPKRKAAIINGVVVELGGKYGDAVLTKVAEDEVVLRSGTSWEVLKLYPTVDKVRSAPAAATRATRNSKANAKVNAKPKAATNPAADPAGAGGMGGR